MTTQTINENSKSHSEALLERLEANYSELILLDIEESSPNDPSDYIYNSATNCDSAEYKKIIGLRKASVLIDYAFQLIEGNPDPVSCDTNLFDVSHIHKQLKEDCKNAKFGTSEYLLDEYRDIKNKINSLTQLVNNYMKLNYDDGQSNVVQSNVGQSNSVQSNVVQTNDVQSNDICSKEIRDKDTKFSDIYSEPDYDLRTMPPPPNTRSVLNKIQKLPILIDFQNKKEHFSSANASASFIKMSNVKLNQDSNFTIKLREIECATEMASIPAGQLVFYTGGRVPKIALTTGTKSWPSVPLNCRIWTPVNNCKKYSILNPKLMTLNESRPQYSHYYYVDEVCAQQNGLKEDTSRNFRMPSRNMTDKKMWPGYNVYDCATFGDSLELAGQLRSVKTENARDLYQFALWFMVIAMAHHQIENN